ncbi:hypothetical protein GCM10022261_18400 [Brevibacterium daeguense]|uniref:Uncharacterized protein n=1 Tax=Brevibacterium daeguense TaxID=909936 RepID=A0ABP8EK41_9MICO
MVLPVAKGPDTSTPQWGPALREATTASTGPVASVGPVASAGTAAEGNFLMDKDTRQAQHHRAGRCGKPCGTPAVGAGILD